MDYEHIRNTLIQRGMDLWNAPEGKVLTLDPKIIPLIAVLNFFDYRTTQSCEGHPLGEWKERMNNWAARYPNEPMKIIHEDPHRITYEVDRSKSPLYPTVVRSKKQKVTHQETPWVFIDIQDPERVSNLEDIISKYNSSSKINWRLERLNKIDDDYELTIPPIYNHHEMQEDIPKLTEFLHDELSKTKYSVINPTIPAQQ
jgi:hypothetical protein